MRIAIALTGLLSIALTTTTVASARTWRVPSECPNIQAGISAATAGDTVLLTAGTYTGAGNRNIDFLGKAITVTSESGPEMTIIDCQGHEQGMGCGFVFQSGEGPSSILSGVTIRNGWTHLGSGIYCDGSSPTISGNIITRNGTLMGSGGGIACCNYSSPTISGNIISQNSSDEGDGAGIYCGPLSSPVIAGNTIIGNVGDSVFGFGGGICGGSSSTISGNIISGNYASHGGGIYCSGTVTISGNIIDENWAWGEGGGICCEGGSPLISGNTVSGNGTLGNGGGISCYYSSPSISNTIIAFGTQGKSIHCDGSEPQLTCCDVYGNAGGDWVDCIADQYGVSGNFSADPLFCMRWPGDYCIDYSSPCTLWFSPSGCGLIGAGGVGCDQPTRIQPTTWGHIKTLFR